jgi:hypothetical protein
MTVRAEFAPKPISYPSLREYDLCGENYVVLFTEPHKGTVVKSNVERLPIGYHSEGWTSRGFKLFIGLITLENIS